MKILSLFDGISCARVALERVGIPVEVYYASEVEKNAIKVSQKNYPDIIQVGDVTKLTFGISITKKEQIDLLIGGSPCQDLSIAGKRKGLDGERSGLFWEYVRLLNEVKPKYFILENVASMSKESRDIISETLGVEPVMINASLVSAQNRKRLFWIGKKNEVGIYTQVNIEQPEDRKIYLKDIIEFGTYNGEKTEDNAVVIKQVEKVKVRKFPVNIQKLKDTLREHKTFTIKEIALKLNQPQTLAEHWFRKDESFAIPSEEIWFELKNLLSIETDEFDKSITEFEIRDGKYDMSHRVYKINGKSPTLTTITGGKQKKIIDDNYQVRELTPIECERLQGLPDNYTDGVSNTQRYKALGNGFNVDVVAHILSFIK